MWVGVPPGALCSPAWRPVRVRTYVRYMVSHIDPNLRPPVPLRKVTGRPPDPNRRRPTELRVCPRHGQVEFALYGKVTPRWRCKRCVGEAVTRRHQKLKRILVEEAGGSCAVCDYKGSITNLHFHHVDPTKKSFEINCSRGKALATYRKEAKKCVLVCANCHGEIEASLIDSPPAGATFADYGSVRKRLRRVA